MNRSKSLELLIENFSKRRPIRGGSLIITVYGDAIVPRGGTVWLGSLIKLLEPLGLNQRLVRTSVFRLTQEDWLSAEQVGRRSFYSLTGSGRRRFEQAFKRVFAAHYPDWDGKWMQVLLSQVALEKRKQVREQLQWLGFGSLAPTLLLHPQADPTEVKTTLQDLGVLDDAIIFSTLAEELTTSRAMRLQVKECWNLDGLSQHYELFLSQFRPVWQEFSQQDRLEPQACFMARTLLAHEYRKILLSDPLLPEALLPGDWEGRAARQLCRNLYRLIWEPAEQHLQATLENADGPLPEPDARFYQRYGGLR
ncbi:MAG: phenylacetic acid degradation operon negative regulatory protein PaaX [Motiliproteus sp.]